MKHTQGEWSTSKYSNIHGIEYGIYANDNRSDIVLVRMAATQDETDANAKLIAASPELLEALQACLKCLNMDSDMQEDFAPEIKQANAAIQKATN